MADRAMVSPNNAREPYFPPLLARQCSLYNLTFDEVQRQLGNIGKPLNRMNLDELLRNVILVEEGRLVQNNSSSSSSSASFFLGNLNLNGTLSRKTVDEVWKEIVHRQHVNEVANQSVHQQLTLGETTLEEFLVRAGVINPQPIMAIDPMVMVSPQTNWLPFQMAAVQQQELQMTVLDSNFNVSESVYENPVVDMGFSENQLAMPAPMPSISSTCSDSHLAAQRKLRCSDVMEKTIERRQKRMIKNRESAARSRARKQAYTQRLLQDVSDLTETNNLLKRQKEVDILLSSNPTSMPKYQLRRNSSASF
ncbi:ABSCISIC ACID-INSENSITIVE 5-like protein 3 isoform X4 [Juglans microcarpa x Juglans regia]|uniref:ABSCISIC ACID-INSENSITIVE 5-like protein 3 isoform X4 n=1 Tax=Juglans microcarpa x Juglans regia TaxID=2249226 RepID=UPI001B7EBDD8|nr:ABSCISIC ACID-INSENSITIVE 5-like protein 3 isoform X4 [Juglans microcarpa x Juglans regia]